MLGTFELCIKSILTAVKEPLYEDEKATLECKWHWIGLRYEYWKVQHKIFQRISEEFEDGIDGTVSWEE